MKKKRVAKKEKHPKPKKVFVRRPKVGKGKGKRPYTKNFIDGASITLPQMLKLAKFLERKDKWGK